MPDNSLTHDGILMLKMPRSRVICAIGFPSVSCVPHTLSFTLLGRGLLDFLHNSCLQLRKPILIFYYSMKLEQSQCKIPLLQALIEHEQAWEKKLFSLLKHITVSHVAANLMARNGKLRACKGQQASFTGSV